MITTLLSLLITPNIIPPFARNESWAREGVSEVEFAVDLADCRAAFLESLPGSAQVLFDRQGDWPPYSTIPGALSAQWVHAMAAYDACFEARGYERVNLTGRERRVIYGRYTEPAVRDAMLFEVATEG